MKTGVLLIAAFSLLLISFSPAFSQNHAQRIFKSNNEVVFIIIGAEQQYEFISDRLSARITRDQQQFEFILPMETLMPVNDPLHSKILLDIFPLIPYANIYLTASLEDETVFLREFTTPTPLLLNGVLTLNNINFNVPIEMTVYAQENSLYYDMAASFNLGLLNREYTGRYADVITGEFQIIVNNAHLSDAFRE